MLFGGFLRGLYSVQKFDSDSEWRMAIILDRDSQKWFRPASGQFKISYKLGVSQHDYQPDFVAETADCISMLEPKVRNEMTAHEVLAKEGSSGHMVHPRHDPRHQQRRKTVEVCPDPPRRDCRKQTLAG